MIPFGVEDADDNDILALNAIEQFLRKTPCQHSPETTIIFRVTFGRCLQQPENAVYLVQELAAQRSPMLFIPAGRLG